MTESQRHARQPQPAHIEQVAAATGQPIEPRHHKHVTGLKAADHLGQFGPIGLGARDLLLEDLGAAGSHQLGVTQNP
jgi:hypothetical protein